MRNVAGNDPLDRHGVGQEIRGRLAQGDPHLELGPVVVDDGVQVVEPGACQQVEAVQKLDREHVVLLRAAHRPDPDQVFVISEIAGANALFIRADLGIACVSLGVGLGDLRGPY